MAPALPVLLEPWVAVPPTGEAALSDELVREVGEGHVLFGRPVQARARRLDRDDVLFEVLRTGEWAVVHLAWTGRREPPPYPATQVYRDVRAWASTMVDDNREFGGTE